jgi:lipoprotein NlpD
MNWLKHGRSGSRALRRAAACATLALAAACTVTGTRQAPIVDRSTAAGTKFEAARAAAERSAPAEPTAVAPAREAREGTYVVQRGDTLYSIALAFGQDFRDLARWNGLDDPSKLAVGQALRVAAPEGGAPAMAASVPIQPVSSVETRPLASAAPTPLPPVGAGGATAAPSPSAAAPSTTPPAAAGVPSAAAPPVPSTAPSNAPSTQSTGAPVVSTGAPMHAPAPTAAAGLPGAPGSGATAAGVAGARPPEPAGADIAKPAPAPKTEPARAAVPDPALGWAWPAAGKVVEEFHETRNKGIDISGKEGDAVLAAGDGQVVYSGSGLRGYGNLVIVKHTDDYISAYAHNRQILVKQGQPVKRGQKIAELGKSDADTPKLHFEIRRQGKPVDPMKYLPAR